MSSCCGGCPHEQHVARGTCGMTTPCVGTTVLETSTPHLMGAMYVLWLKLPSHECNCYKFCGYNNWFGARGGPLGATFSCT